MNLKLLSLAIFISIFQPGCEKVKSRTEIREDSLKVNEARIHKRQQSEFLRQREVNINEGLFLSFWDEMPITFRQVSLNYEVEQGNLVKGSNGYYFDIEYPLDSEFMTKARFDLVLKFDSTKLKSIQLALQKSLTSQSMDQGLQIDSESIKRVISLYTRKFGKFHYNERKPSGFRYIGSGITKISEWIWKGEKKVILAESLIIEGKGEINNLEKKERSTKISSFNLTYCSSNTYLKQQEEEKLRKQKQLQEQNKKNQKVLDKI